MPDIVMLQDLRKSDADLVGAKAASLGELISAGAPVPPGFCMSSAVYDRLIRPILQPDIEALLAGLREGAEDRDLVPRSDGLRRAVEGIVLTHSSVADLEATFRRLSATGRGLAVRSSGNSEDTESASSAGQYHTELGVRTIPELHTALKRCWASLWTVHAIRYRQHSGIPHENARMAVVVQVMVQADAAGVMFTSAGDGDTAGGSADTRRIVIESSWGLGEAVVSGLVDPDRFEVTGAEWRVENTRLATKSEMVVWPGDGPSAVDGGVTVVEVPRNRRTVPSLTAEQAVELARHGAAIEAHFGSPQDVEWAVADGGFFFLQARPLTRQKTILPRVHWESPIDGAWWARISICDSWLPEPLSPLFATTLFPQLVKKWAQNWAGPESAQRRNPLLPTPMWGTINGFGYLRLDYPMNKYPIRTLKLALDCYRFHFGPLERRWRKKILPRHAEWFAEMSDVDLPGLAVDDILGLLREAQELSGTYWAILGGLAWYWNGGEWLLDKFYPALTKPITKQGGEVPGPGSLLQGYPTKTLESEVELNNLSYLDTTSPGFEEGFGVFLKKFGHQVFQLDFVEPTPAEEPAAFLVTMSAYRDGRTRRPLERLALLAERRDVLRGEIDAGLHSSPLRRVLLRKLLAWNHRYGQLRDESLFYFTLGWPFMRRGYLELGRRLVTVGMLQDAEGVFYLTEDELTAALRNVVRGGVPESLADSVSERRALRERQKSYDPPRQVPESMRIFMGKLDVTSVALLGQGGKSKSSTGLSGSAVSPGRVTAPARHISSVRDFEKLEAGDVLVASYITPAWSPLLAIAGGVVTDSGGLLSHGSIVAREYGIPAVMGTMNATKVIQDGQIVTVDGDRGKVY